MIKQKAKDILGLIIQCESFTSEEVEHELKQDIRRGHLKEFKKFLRPDETSDYLCVSTWKVRGLVQVGVLKVAPGRNFLISRDSAVRYSMVTK